MNNEACKRISRWPLIGLFGMVALMLAAGGYGFYRQETQAIRTEKLNDLKAIGELKCNQIVAWRHERLGDAAVLSSGILQANALQWFKTVNESTVEADLVTRLDAYRQSYGYQNVLLVAPDGHLLLSLDPALKELEARTKDLVAQTVASHQPTFGDFFRCERCNQVHLDVAAPILDAGKRTAGVLILRSDPKKLLYPLIQSWPTPSRSAETLLLRRDGEDALFLNVLRHRPDPAMTLRIPLSRTEVPVVQAALGRSGEFEGRDYRGVKVLADLRPVPGSPWSMVAKVDANEILAEARYRGGVILLLVTLGVLMTGGLAAFMFSYRSRNLYKALFRAELERRKAQEETRATLYGIGDGVIATDASGNVTRMNPVAASLTGWSEAEALGRPMNEVFRIVNEETRAEVESPVDLVLREGKIVGLANHTLLIAKDGTERPIADSGAPIHGEQGAIMGVVLVFRDQSAERAAQAALSESEQRLRLLFERMPLGYQSLDADGCFIEVNPAWLATLGYERDEVIGHWFGEFLPPAYVEAFRQRFPQFKEVGEVHNEFDMRRKDGTIIRVAFDGKIGHDEQGNFKQTHCILSDITQRKQAEEALRESEAHYRLLFNSIHDAVFLHGFSADDGMPTHFLQVNDVACQRYGYSREEWLRMRPQDLDAPEGLAAIPGVMRQLQSQGHATWEGMHRAKDGRLVPVEISNVLFDYRGSLMILSTVRDITERKQAETALRKNEEQYRNLVQNLGSGLVVHGPDTSILYSNPMASELLGLNEDQMRGKVALDPAWCFLWEDGTPVPVEEYPVNQVLASGKMIKNQVIGIRRPDRTAPIWLLFSAYPERDANARILKVVVTFHDITDRKQAELQIKESEERYRALFDRSLDAVYLHDLEGRFLDANPAALQALGYTREEIHSLNFSSLVTCEQDLVRAYQGVEELVTTGTQKEVSEYRLRRKDGTLVWFELLGSLVLKDGKPIAIQGIGRDITERKQAVEALRMTQFSVDHAADALYWMTADARIVSVNEAACRTLDYTREELLKLGISDIDPDTSAEIWLDYWMQLKKQGNISFETRHRTRDGQIIPVEITANHIEFGGKEYSCAFVRDITERKQAEEALRESEERFRMMVDTIPQMAAIAKPDGDIYWFNQRWYDYTGATPEQMAGGGWQSVHDPQVLPKVLEQWRTSLASGQPFGMEFPLRGADGRFRHFLTRILPVRNSGGQIVRWVGTNTDITERQRAEEEREKLHAQLLQAQKMESVGRLAGGVAHDFNNMLGVIIGHTEMALEEVAPSAALYDDLQEIQKAALRSADLTRQLLAFARKQTVSPKVLDLNQTVASMLKMLQRLIGEDIELTWKPEPDLWPVKIDPSQVDQMLVNLSVNARDAIVGVGDLTIETGNVTFDEPYCRTHDDFAPGDYVLLAVSDTGTGMDKATLEQIFEPFFTTKEVGKGTGLGLATVYGAVKQNQGFINVYSEPGRGTTFKIYLPRAKAVETRIAGATKEPTCGTETVLLAEDEASILKLGVTILKKHGYTVLAARTPAEALAIAAGYEGPIHLLITDVVMPGMNGKELKERLQALRPEIKVLFMSGYTSDVIAHQGVIDEDVAFLQKPFSVNTLTQKVRDALQ